MSGSRCCWRQGVLTSMVAVFFLYCFGVNTLHGESAKDVLTIAQATDTQPAPAVAPAGAAAPAGAKQPAAAAAKTKHRQKAEIELEKSQALFDKALAALETAAGAGSAIAQRQLASCYRYGIGVNVDYSRAVGLLKKAAASGDSEAQVLLGDCFEQGHGVAKSPQRAIEWYRRAAAAGSVAASYRLGFCTEFGIGTARNINQAIAWYEKAANAGHADALYRLGDYYLWESKGISANEPAARAVRYYERAAAHGHSDAQAELGECYLEGRGVPQSDENAVSWFKKATAQGSTLAATHLGDSYRIGRGVEQDLQRAVDSYRIAAEGGDGAAEFKLGLSFEHGLGNAAAKTEQERLALAKPWYERAANRAYIAAYIKLGQLYEQLGSSDGEDLTPRALQLYRKAATEGNAEALYLLGRCYERGIGTKAEASKAIAAYRAAARHDHPEAMAALGRCYRDGRGVEQDFSEATQWLRLAARGLSGPAPRYDVSKPMRFYLQMGLSCVDPADREAWLAWAAEQGHPGACYDRGFIFEGGLSDQPRDHKQAAFWYERAVTALAERRTSKEARRDYDFALPERWSPNDPYAIDTETPTSAQRPMVLEENTGDSLHDVDDEP